MSRVEYRDYVAAKANPCDAEPRWLADELTAVNGLLARYLSETEKLEGPEHENARTLAQEATRTLPPVMEAHRGTLAALERCSFRSTGAFPEISRRGTELLEAARARLAATPAVTALSEAREKWKEEAPQREATGRANWCPEKPQVGRPDVYYARQEPDGHAAWLFCDGHRVELAPGGEPQLIEPEGLSRREKRLIQPKRYLEAASNFPAEEMDRPPDSKPAPAKDATPPAAAASGGPG
ncbi:hypothetical protein [Pyxidicoccus parkwayensis]|nr:hypothetical protein [Pyxidicoccus parkwaysis]